MSSEISLSQVSEFFCGEKQVVQLWIFKWLVAGLARMTSDGIRGDDISIIQEEGVPSHPIFSIIGFVWLSSSKATHNL
jgi:hypothetical protein